MAILAEIIRSLDICRTLGGGGFSASAHILYIWARSHFPGKATSKCVPYQPDVIKRFYLSDWSKPTSKGKWVRYLLQNGRQRLQWLAPWLRPVDRFLYRCGDFPWVPLLGVYRGTGYAPWSFRRQVGAQHCVPATNGLNEALFDYDDVKKSMIRSPQIKRAWEKTRWVGRDNIGVSSFGLARYEVWRANRGHGFFPPPPPSIEPGGDDDIEENIPTIPNEEEILREIEMDTLREQVKRLERMHNTLFNVERAQFKEEKDRLQQALLAAQNKIEEIKEENQQVQESRKRKYDHENEEAKM